MFALSIQGSIAAVGLVLLALGVLISARAASGPSRSTSSDHRANMDGQANSGPSIGQNPRASNRISVALIAAGAGSLLVAGMLAVVAWTAFGILT